jgi:crossover junction endodeoxyribonuclease RusA
MEVDQVITWLKQQMIMRELKELAAKPALSQRRKWRKRLSLCARIKRRLRRVSVGYFGADGCSVDLPWPPSVNRYWRTFQGRMIISADGRQYKQAVAAVCHGLIPITGYVEVTIMATRPDKRKRDLDNLLKATLDACSGHLWVDDVQIQRLTIMWAAGTEKGGKLMVTARRMGDDLV